MRCSNVRPPQSEAKAQLVLAALSNGTQIILTFRVRLFFSNVQVFDGKIPENILSVVQGQPTLIRSNNDLHDQFSYQFAVAAEKTKSVYPCSFRESFALIGLVSAADDLPNAFDEDAELGKFRSTPFRHPGQEP